MTADLKKHKILLVLPSLRTGGAERVMSFIANNISHEIFDTTLLIIGPEIESSYELDRTKVIYLGKKRVLYAIFPLFSYLKRQKPDLVLSAIGHVNALMALESIFFKKITFIGREVNVISVLSKIQPSQKWYSFIDFTKLSYRLLDMIICQSKDMANDIIKNYNPPKNKIRIINNPISNSFTPKQGYPRNQIPIFITVGSLVERKGHKRILNALSNYNRPFKYFILGDGNIRNEVLAHAKELGVMNNIEHIPFTREVSIYLQQANAFLQGSYVEGFPNALLESCAVGTPAIAFNAPGGINEIIENGINGYIIDNEKEFIEKLNLLLKQQLDPFQVSSTVNERFNKNKILGEYESLFLEMIKKRSNRK